MNLADALVGDSPLSLVARGLQVVVAGLVGYGLLVGNSGLVINGVLALVITFVPSGLEWRYDHAVDPRLDVWIALAALFHTVGFLGLYDVQTGPLALYDQVAHAISASFVAGVGYALVVALDRSSSRVQFPEGFRFVFTVLFIMAFGVGWEILEFAVSGLGSALGGGAPLIQYGKDDIVLDILFNSLAGVVVGLWGTRYFRDMTAIFSRRVLGNEES